MTAGGFSSKRLARVRVLLERHVDSGFVPGAMAVLARHGEVHIEATGTLAYEGGKPGGSVRTHRLKTQTYSFEGALPVGGGTYPRRTPTAFRSGWSEMIVHMSVEHQRVALVTGSSRGLGAAIARRLARDGFAVAVNSLRDDEYAFEVVRTIREEGGVGDAFCADVTDEQQVAELVAAITDRLGTVDVLVVNATGPQPEASVGDVAWADHVAQLNFFVKSPVLLGHALLPGMQTRRYGRIVHVDSEVVHRPPPGRSAYATAKSAQVGLTRSWARELAPFGITVNTVAPGFVPVERHADVSVDITNAYLASVPAARMGTPDDIAHAVSFLASEAAGFVTGQRIVVDGGRSLGS